MERRERNCSNSEFMMPNRTNTDRRGNNALLSYADFSLRPVSVVQDLIENLISCRTGSLRDKSNLYYKFCVFFVQKFFDNRTQRTVEMARNLFDNLIDSEFALFKRSRVLDFLIGFLVHKSDVSPNSFIYGPCLDYVLCKRDRLMNN
ncbi:AC19 [Alphabaculovirus altermyunipunctae]|uniref:AC19 n=1 Tax=Mythimna unipuncta nucleopolyhedrovirus TaxID=447897 RepID=A0A346TPR1_9ABAC|nr:AC19 [Mythimna unipuncta nucleopolyhedrovirus]AXU41571.1 AC19 [Mythimna unipuncta nucleopolyhedrovirus]